MHVANIATLAFHMSKQTSNIDLDTSNLTDEIVTKVQSYANQIVTQKKAVKIANYSLEDAKKLPLRKQLDSGMEEPIRIVSIQDVDMQPWYVAIFENNLLVVVHTRKQLPKCKPL